MIEINKKVYSYNPKTKRVKSFIFTNSTKTPLYLIGHTKEEAEQKAYDHICKKIDYWQERKKQLEIKLNIRLKKDEIEFPNWLPKKGEVFFYFNLSSKYYKKYKALIIDNNEKCIGVQKTKHTFKKIPFSLVGKTKHDAKALAYLYEMNKSLEQKVEEVEDRIDEEKFDPKGDASDYLKSIFS